MYLVLTKDQYTQGWNLEEFEDISEVLQVVLYAKVDGKDVRIAEERGYAVKVELEDKRTSTPEKKAPAIPSYDEIKKEEAPIEVSQSGPTENQSPGSEGDVQHGRGHGGGVQKSRK